MQLLTLFAFLLVLVGNKCAHAQQLCAGADECAAGECCRDDMGGIFVAVEGNGCPRATPGYGMNSFCMFIPGLNCRTVEDCLAGELCCPFGCINECKQPVVDQVVATKCVKGTAREGELCDRLCRCAKGFMCYAQQFPVVQRVKKCVHGQDVQSWRMMKRLQIMFNK